MQRTNRIMAGTIGAAVIAVGLMAPISPASAAVDGVSCNQTDAFRVRLHGNNLQCYAGPGNRLVNIVGVERAYSGRYSGEIVYSTPIRPDGRWSHKFGPNQTITPFPVSYIINEIRLR